MRKGFFIMMVCLCVAGTPMFCKAAETEADGDFQYIENSETERNEETSCQVTVVTECPTGFGLNSYVVLSDNDGQMYRISLSEENGYRDRIYVKAGEYYLIEAKVYDDNTGRYPFERISGEEQFTVEMDDAVKLRFRLRDYDEIEDVISLETGDEDVSAAEEYVQEARFATALDGIAISSGGEQYYPVESSGSGIGSMAISGNAKGNYDLQVRIIKSGVIGEARFSLSLDGGKSLVGDDVTAESFELRDYGLVLYFSTANDSDELKEGDVFTAKIPETFPMTAAKYGEANVVLAGSPEGDYDLLLTVLSSGERGEAKFTVSLDAGNNTYVTDTIPADGIYELPDGMRLCFSDSDGFMKGSEYSAEVRSNIKSVSMIPLYVLAVAVFGAGVWFYLFLLSKRERATEYVIHRWRDRQEKEIYE